jgi:hypothetical protein
MFSNYLESWTVDKALKPSDSDKMLSILLVQSIEFSVHKFHCCNVKVGIFFCLTKLSPAAIVVVADRIVDELKN